MEQGKYALENLELFFNRLGHDKLILQHDAEHAVGAVAKALQRHLGSARVKVRSAPVKSHQSQGSVESANAFLAGQIRTLWASLKHRYPELEPTHNVMPADSARLVADRQVSCESERQAHALQDHARGGLQQAHLPVRRSDHGQGACGREQIEPEVVQRDLAWEVRARRQQHHWHQCRSHCCAVSPPLVQGGSDRCSDPRGDPRSPMAPT